MSEWNWPMVFLYAFVITGIVVAIIGFSQVPTSSKSLIDEGVEESVEPVSGVEPNVSEFYVSVNENRILPSSFDVAFMDRVFFEFTNDASVPVSVGIENHGVVEVVEPGKQLSRSFVASKAGSHAVSLLRDGVVVDSGVLRISSAYVDDPVYRGVYFSVPFIEMPTIQVSRGTGVGVYIESSDGQTYVFESDLGTLVASDHSAEEPVLFEFVEAGEFVFSDKDSDQKITFLVTE